MAANMNKALHGGAGRDDAEAAALAGQPADISRTDRAARTRGGSPRRAARPPDGGAKKRRYRTAEQRAADAARMVDLYVNQRYSIQQIVDEIGMSHATVHRTLTDAKVEMRSRGGDHRSARRTPSTTSVSHR
jgi:DNA invertase Pin-like site-specific DNA recombinase